MKLGGYNIIEESELAGVKWWVQFYNDGRRQDIFRYVGQDPEHKALFFQARQSNSWMIRRWDDMAGKDFKPFLIDTARISALLEELRAE